MNLSEQQQKEQLGKVLWAMANDLRGSMDANNFRDYMLSLIKYTNEHNKFLQGII